MGRSGSSGGRVEFAFGAVFTAIRTVGLGAGRGGPLTVSDVLPSSTGHIWVADARAGALKIYSQSGQLLKTIGRGATGLRRPVSLAAFHGRWIAVLDGGLPAIVILDERCRAVRRFPLPEVDRPLQICSVADRSLAVVGKGWGRSSGRLIHLYTPAGDHLESLFGEPRSGAGRAFAAVTGRTVYLGHTVTDSFASYDVEARAFLSFPNLAARVASHVGGAAGFAASLRGLFATRSGSLIAVYTNGGAAAGEYLYDLYSPNGAPLALGHSSPERVVGVEGPLFYTTRSAAAGVTLRVWKLRYSESATSTG